MKPLTLKEERLRRGWGQVEAAGRLGVSQPYLALLEEGKRPLTTALKRKAAKLYGLQLELPLAARFTPDRNVKAQTLAEHLSRLQYPGFAYVRPRGPCKNPAEVLLTALAQESLEARTAEALPWLLLHYWRMDSQWTVEQAKRLDLQNRFGFVATLARRLSEPTVEANRTQSLRNLEQTLDASRLVREDFFYRPPRNNVERDWLKENSTDDARRWNLFSDLRPEHLQYAA
jgi:transcriptional regulator with XRE-family HTH domain